MIKKECFTPEWIDHISKKLKYNDKILIEKVIRAFSLLEMLGKSGCPFVFKGGTALMLMMETVNRLSIDIDIICPPGTNIEEYVGDFADYGFSDMLLIERRQKTNIPKSHSKFYYRIAYRNNSDEQSYILLDVLYEDLHYTKINEIKIKSPFIAIEGEPLTIKVPSLDDILGDKLTAFAPNTTGIPYYKNGKSCSMEIIKQLHDIARLFEEVENLNITRSCFKKTAKVELSYRNLNNDILQIFEDIRQTAICISTRGKSGNGNFALLQDGIIRVKAFMFKERYVLENAITDASKAAYLATLIEKDKNRIEYYSGNPQEIAEMTIRPSLTNKLNKLKINLPEAYYYWAKTSELL